MQKLFKQVTKTTGVGSANMLATGVLAYMAFQVLAEGYTSVKKHFASKPRSKNAAGKKGSKKAS